MDSFFRTDHGKLEHTSIWIIEWGKSFALQTLKGKNDFSHFKSEFNEIILHLRAEKAYKFSMSSSISHKSTCECKKRLHKSLKILVVDVPFDKNNATLRRWASLCRNCVHLTISIWISLEFLCYHRIKTHVRRFRVAWWP